MSERSKMRLALAFVMGLEQALCFRLVYGLEGRLFPGGFVFEIKDAPHGRRINPNRCFIVSLMVASVKQAALTALAGSGRALAELWPNFEPAVQQVKNPVKPSPQPLKFPCKIGGF